MRSWAFPFAGGFVAGAAVALVVVYSARLMPPGKVFVPPPTQAAVASKTVEALPTPPNIQPSSPPGAASVLRAAINPSTPPIGLPIEGLKKAGLHDSFEENHFGHRHEAIDIMEPRGTPVHAVSDGVIEKLFVSKAGGLTIYQFEPTGAFCYYYAHLDRYADGLHDGQKVSRGDVIGFVGFTGDASPNAPHLHFEIHRLGPEKHYWEGEAIDPYPILMAAK